MDLNDEDDNDAYEDLLQLAQEQQARLREVETWLALLVVRHGVRSDLGWRYEMTTEEANWYRAIIRAGSDPRVIITASIDAVFQLDVF